MEFIAFFLDQSIVDIFSLLEAALMSCVELVLMRISGPNYHLVPNFCKIIQG